MCRAVLTDEQVECMRLRRANGESIVGLAREFGVTELLAGRAVRGLSYKKAPGPITRIYTPPPTLFTSMPEVRRILQMAHDGVAPYDIAAETGRDPRTVRDIITGRRHASVSPEIPRMELHVGVGGRHITRCSESARRLARAFRMISEGYSVSDAASSVGLGDNYLRSRWRKAGGRTGRQGRLVPDEEKARIAELWQSGKSIHEIASIVGCSRYSVRKYGRP